MVVFRGLAWLAVGLGAYEQSQTPCSLTKYPARGYVWGAAPLIQGNRASFGVHSKVSQPNAGMGERRSNPDNSFHNIQMRILKTMISLSTLYHVHFSFPIPIISSSGLVFHLCAFGLKGYVSFNTIHI